MKRSITLFISNVLATLYAAYLLWTFGGAIIAAGGTEYLDTLGAYFEFAFDILGTQSSGVTFLYVILILLGVHIVTFTLGCLIGWLALAYKKSGAAKFAATLYLIGTLCFPIYIFFGLPVTIIGFVGGSKQKKINIANKEALEA